MTIKQSRLLCVLLSGAAIAAGLSLTPNVQAQDNELRIGFIAPLTGPFAQVGNDMVDGFNMYLDEAKSEFAGAKVKFIVEDDQAKPDTGVTKAKKLILQDKVHMLVGGVLASTGYALAAATSRPANIASDLHARMKSEPRPTSRGFRFTAAGETAPSYLFRRPATGHTSQSSASRTGTASGCPRLFRDGTTSAHATSLRQDFVIG